MNLPKRKILLLVSLFTLLFITVFLSIFFFLKNRDENTEWDWTKYENFFEYRQNPKEINPRQFVVYGYLYAPYLTSDKSLHLDLFVYNENIWENKLLRLTTPLDKTNIEHKDFDSLKLGDTFEILFKKDKNNETVIVIEKVDMGKKKNEYLWILFQYLSQNSPVDGYDPIILLATKELLNEENMFSKKEKSEIERFYEKIKAINYDVSTSILPCFVSKNLNIQYDIESNHEILDTTDSYVNTAFLVENFFDETTAMNMDEERAFNLLADKIVYCNMQQEENIVEYENLLKLLSEKESINREIVKWIIEINMRLSSEYYNEESISNSSKYFDKENFLILSSNKLYRDCILNNCDLNFLLAKVAAKHKTVKPDGECDFTNLNYEMQENISIIILSILGNE